MRSEIETKKYPAVLNIHRTTSLLTSAKWLFPNQRNKSVQSLPISVYFATEMTSDFFPSLLSTFLYYADFFGFVAVITNF
jgi:hypothetical protein